LIAPVSNLVFVLVEFEYGCSNKTIFSRHLAAYTMPHQTERQQAADALQRAFLINLMAEHEEDLLDFNSDSSSSGNNTDSSSSSDDELLSADSEMLLETLGNLYSQRYLKERTEITKSSEILKLLLTDWKVNWQYF
jgi:hypothetical protein